MAGTAGLVLGGRYRLEEPVGQGGMGRVWRGRDELLDRRVAVKEVLIAPEVPDDTRERMIARTAVEARAAGRLRHPSIVTVYDVVEQQSAPWIVMEFLDAVSLGTMLAADGGIGWARAAAVGAGIADALAHAHAAGVVHRDLKPDNILLDGERPVLTDFGIARILDSAASLTSTHTLIGTPQYMSPEQLDGQPVEAAADMWALGATLYAAVEGRPPFTGPSLMAVITAIMTRPVPVPEHGGPLTELITGLLDKEPARRPDAAAVARHLRDLPTADPVPGTARPPRVRRRTVLIGGLAAAMLGGGGVALAELGPWRRTGPDIVHWNDAQLLFTLDAVGLTGQGDNHVYSVAFSPDGKTLASGGDNNIRLWDVAARASIGLLTDNADTVSALAFSPDGRTLADGTGNGDGSAQLWNVRSRSLTATLHGFSDQVDAVAFSPDGRTLATASGGVIRLTDLRTRAAITSFKQADSHVWSVLFTPDGRTLITLDEDRIGFWDTRTHATIATVTSGTGLSLYGLALSPDGRTLASGDDKGIVKLWNVATRTHVATIDAYADAVNVVAFSPDGRTLAGGTSDGPVMMWDVRTRKRVARLVGNTNAATSLAFTPDGTLLACGGQDGKIRVWAPR